MFKAGEKDGEISEDDCRRLVAKVQDGIDAFVKIVDEQVAKKEEEVREI